MPRRRSRRGRRRSIRSRRPRRRRRRRTSLRRQVAKNRKAISVNTQWYYNDYIANPAVAYVTVPTTPRFQDMWQLSALPNAIQANGGRIGNKLNVSTIRAQLSFVPAITPGVVSRVRVALVLFPEPFSTSSSQLPPAATSLPTASQVFATYDPAQGSTVSSFYQKNSATRYKIMRDFTFYLKSGSTTAATVPPLYQTTTRPIIKYLSHTFNKIPIEWFRNPQSAAGVPVDQMPNRNLFAVAIWCETVQGATGAPADIPTWKLVNSRITYCDT